VIIIGGCDLLEGTFKVALKLLNLETLSVSSVKADVMRFRMYLTEFKY